jgi:hypothetical protein
MENNIVCSAEVKDKGYVWLPYITKIVSTSINGETVWYANKWKNFFLKIKHFFIPPKYLKNKDVYIKKLVNSSYYETIKIKKCYEKNNNIFL